MLGRGCCGPGPSGVGWVRQKVVGVRLSFGEERGQERDLLLRRGPGAGILGTLSFQSGLRQGSQVRDLGGSWWERGCYERLWPGLGESLHRSCPGEGMGGRVLGCLHLMTHPPCLGPEYPLPTPPSLPRPVSPGAAQAEKSTHGARGPLLSAADRPRLPVPASKPRYSQRSQAGQPLPERGSGGENR